MLPTLCFKDFSNADCQQAICLLTPWVLGQTSWGPEWELRWSLHKQLAVGFVSLHAPTSSMALMPCGWYHAPGGRWMPVVVWWVNGPLGRLDTWTGMLWITHCTTNSHLEIGGMSSSPLHTLFHVFWLGCNSKQISIMVSKESSKAKILLVGLYHSLFFFFPLLKIVL